jgi:hypothetical protein
MKVRQIDPVALLAVGIAVIALAMIAVWNTAWSQPSLYPSIAQLQQALNATPGAQLPREIDANGRVWTAWYVGARTMGGGRYAVIVQLR